MKKASSLLTALFLAVATSTFLTASVAANAPQNPARVIVVKKDTHEVRLVTSDTLSTKELTQAVLSDPSVEKAFPDRKGRIPRIPNEAEASIQPQVTFGQPAQVGWYEGTPVYIGIRADVAKPFIQSHTGDRGVMAFLGSGFNSSPALDAHRPDNGLWGMNFVPGKDATYLIDEVNHETRVSAQADMTLSGSSSMAFWFAKLDDNGLFFVSSIIAAQQYVLDQKTLWNASGHQAGMNFVGLNLSLGLNGDGPDLVMIRDLNHELETSGVFISMAAGNQPSITDPVYDLDQAPTANGVGSGARCISGAMTVAATDATGSQLTSFAYYGMNTVEAGAPGGGNVAVGSDGNIQGFGGSSASAPIVGAVGAELVRIGNTPLTARRQIWFTGRVTLPTDKIKGGKFIDVAAAFATPVSPEITTPHSMSFDGKQKYFTHRRQLAAHGSSDADVCVQAFSGLLMSAGDATFDGVVSGSVLPAVVDGYSKEGGDAHPRKIKVRP